MAQMSGPECGKEISDVGPARAKSKKSLIVGVCVLVLLVVGIFVAVQQQKAVERDAYIASLKELREQAIRGGSLAEGLCNATKKVWYNTIYEEKDSGTDKYTRTFNGAGEFHDDFNTSLSNLYADDDVKTIISGLQASRETVSSIMKGLQNPPAEFSACYEAANSLYDAYCGLVDLAISPSGSLQTYSANFGEYDDDLLKYYNKLEILMPDE